MAKASSASKGKPKASGKAKKAAPGGKRKLRKGQHKDSVPLQLENGFSASEDENEGEEEDAQLPDGAEAFASSLNLNGMARTRISLKKEHRLAKPPQEKLKADNSGVKAVASAKGDDETEEGIRMADLSEDDFAFGSGASDDELSVMSDADLDGSVTDFSDSDLDDEDLEDLSDGTDLSGSPAEEEWTGFGAGSEAESDIERAYESRKKRRKLSPAADGANGLLPIRLADGSVVRHPKAPAPTAPTAKSRVTFAEESEADEQDEVEERDETMASAYATTRSNPLGARFGRPAIRAILELSDTKSRLNAARDEIAALSRDIIASPELGLNLLRRLVSFCPTKFTGKGEDDSSALAIDQPIRALALLSTLAVFLDILPGYRIRPVTDSEKQTRVSQVVLRQREWEDGLVTQYRRYLEVCEKEVNGKSPLQQVALKCLCNLLEEKTHFNYAVNIMDSVARHLSQPRWDESSRTCLDAVATVFRKDQSGQDSLHLVRLLSKTIKAANFRVEPALLDVFLHLRLKQELGDVRASHHGAERTPKPGQMKGKNGSDKKPFINKKARKALKAKAQVRKDIAEAEVEVVEEDKQKAQTETLKLLFALYFRVIKLDSRSPLLPATLEGLARFAHLVNVDFFRDLLENLKRLMRIQAADAEGEADKQGVVVNLRERLLCIVTAFELLTGQGEALNIDLADFVTELYSLLLVLGGSCNLETQPGSGFVVTEDGGSTRKRASLASEADLLFRALHQALFARGHGRSAVGPQRARAFGKRVLTCALSWPAASALRALDIVARLIAREPTLEAVLGREGEDEEDGPVMQGEEGEAVWWEVGELRRTHYDPRVREAAARLLSAKE